MLIHGLQKLTLLDYPGKIACTVFFGGCNFRCPFCHNAELLDASAPAVMDDGELLRFLRTRQSLLEGVCLTGGEPLLRGDLPVLLEQIKSLGFSVKLDTNGSFPEKLRQLVASGLVDYVAMDVKNSPALYAETVGLASVELTSIRRSIDFLLENRADYEFRTTVVREFHTVQSLAELSQWLTGAKRYYLQGFVDRDTVLRPGLHALSRPEMEALAEAARRWLPEVSLRGVE